MEVRLGPKVSDGIRKSKSELKFCLFSCPHVNSSVRIRRLDPCYADAVDEFWDFKYDGSLEMIRAQLELGLGFAAYVEGREEPVAWTLVARKVAQ